MDRNFRFKPQLTKFARHSYRHSIHLLRRVLNDKQMRQVILFVSNKASVVS